MSRRKEYLTSLFEDIKRLEASGNASEASLLTDSFLEASGKADKWIYHHNKTGTNVDYDIASKIVYLTERDCFDGISDEGIWAFTQIFLTGNRGRKSLKETLKMLQDWPIEDPKVAVLLGNLWETGIAVGKKNIQKAAYQYYLATILYDGEDGYNYARLFYDGPLKRDYREAFRAVSGANQPVTMDCLNLLGRMFIEGKTGCYNPKLAYRCFRMAAKLMYNHSLVNYALLTYFGLGCRAERDKAFKLLKIADFAGSDDAIDLMNKLESGEIHKFSPDLFAKIPSNFSKHVSSLKKRAKEGDVKAMIQLGDIYYGPILFESICDDKAIYWYLQAAKSGSLYAAAYLKELWIYQGSNVFLSKESQECLEQGRFEATYDIASKVNSTELVDISYDLIDDDDSKRLPFCPVEALYWAIAVKDEPNHKFADDWRGWLKSLQKERIALQKEIHKLQPEYEDEFTEYDKL